MAVLQEEGAAMGSRGGPAGAGGMLAQMMRQMGVEMLFSLTELGGTLVKGSVGRMVAIAGPGAGTGAVVGGR